MDNPTFFLEAVVKDHNEMQDFEGPLNLILMLLSKNKVEIRDIQVSVILEQYLEHIQKMQEMDLEVASEFVQMASHLLYIKTRMLLSEDKEISELDALMNTLEHLRCRDSFVRIKAVIPHLAGAAAQGARLHSKSPEPRPADSEYRYQHQSLELLKALSSVFAKGRRQPEPQPALSLLTRPVVYGVREKSGELLSLLRRKGRVRLGEIYARAKDKSELVATFLSVLELCGTGSILILSDEREPVLQFLGGDTAEILENISE